MAENSGKATQVQICYVCGDKGFTNALIDCSKCLNTFAHQYCLGIPPGSIDSSFTWVCEDCCEPSQHQPSISMMPSDVLTKSNEEACDVSTHLNDTERKMKPITTLYSESCSHEGKENKNKRKRDSLNPDTGSLPTLRPRVKRHKDTGCSHKGKENKNKRKEDSLNPNTGSFPTLRPRIKRHKGWSVSTNKYGRGEDVTNNKPAKVGAKVKNGSKPKVRVHPNNNVKNRNTAKRQHNCVTKGESLTDPNNWKLILMEEQPEPLLTLKPIEYKGSSEQAETGYESEPKFMDCPKEIMRGVILLVSPLGEIYIECASFTDDLYPTCLETALLRLTNGYSELQYS